MNEHRNSAETPATPNTDRRRQDTTPRKPDPRWQVIAEQMEAKTSVSVNVTGVATNKERRPVGLNTTLTGLRAFLPGSLIPRSIKADSLVGQTIQVKITECAGGKIVVSLAAHLAEEAGAFVKTLSVGDEVTGQVVSVVDQLGFFVNIGKVEALLHHSQTGLVDGSPKRFEVGETVTAKVASINLETNKVGLTMRPSRRERERQEPVNRRQDHGQGRQYRDSGSSRSDEPVTPRPTPVKRVVPVKPAVTTTVVSKPAKPRTSSPGRKSEPMRKFGSFAELAAYMGTLPSGEAAGGNTDSTAAGAETPATEGAEQS